MYFFYLNLGDHTMNVCAELGDIRYLVSGPNIIPFNASMTQMVCATQEGASAKQNVDTGAMNVGVGCNTMEPQR